MLLVKTQLKNSRIHGVGIFADEDIPKGTAIWRDYEGFDLEYSVEAVDKLPRLRESRCSLVPISRWTPESW